MESKPSLEEFSQRKKDHIEISLREESQAPLDQFSQIHLQHNPVPEINLEEITLSTDFKGEKLASPFFISSMTLGHDEAQAINERLMGAAQELNWMMGVGSQRRQLIDSQAAKESESLRKKFPELVLFGNVGLTQVIQHSPQDVQKLVDSLEAQFMVVHTNPLQEAIQPEGTPQFKGGLEALAQLCDQLSVPVVLKETGCGFSASSLAKLKEINLAAVDLSGMGGTHWGRVETLRIDPNHPSFQVGSSFNNWGISTVESLKNAMVVDMPYEVWASGGVRNGLHGAKLLAMGAQKIGVAQPILKAAVVGEKELIEQMKIFDQELKVAMFCMGVKNLEQLVGNGDLYQWM